MEKRDNSGSILPSNPLLPARFSTADSPPVEASSGSNSRTIAPPAEIKREPEDDYECAPERPDDELSNHSSDCVLYRSDESVDTEPGNEDRRLPSEDEEGTESMPTSSVKSESTDTGHHQEPGQWCVVSAAESPREDRFRNIKIKQEPVDKDEVFETAPFQSKQYSPTNISRQFENERESSSPMEVDGPSAPAAENFILNRFIKREPGEEIGTPESKSCPNDVGNERNETLPEMDAQSDGPVAAIEIRSRCSPSRMRVKEEPIDKNGTDKDLESASGQETSPKVDVGSENPSEQRFVPIAALKQKEESVENTRPVCDTSLVDSNITTSFSSMGITPVGAKETGTVNAPANSPNLESTTDDFAFNRLNEVRKSDLSSAEFSSERTEDKSPVSEESVNISENNEVRISLPLSKFYAHFRSEYSLAHIKECIAYTETIAGLKIQRDRYSLFYGDKTNSKCAMPSPFLPNPSRQMHETDAVSDSAAIRNTPENTTVKSAQKVTEYSNIKASGAPAAVTCNPPSKVFSTRVMKSSAEKNGRQVSAELYEATPPPPPALFSPENGLQKVPSLDVVNSPKSLKIPKQKFIKTEKTSICDALSPPPKMAVPQEIPSLTGKSVTSQISNGQENIRVQSEPAPFTRLEATSCDSLRPTNSAPTEDTIHFEGRIGALPSKEELQGILLNAQAVGAAISEVVTTPFMASMGLTSDAVDFGQQAWKPSLECPSSNSESFPNSIHPIIDRLRDLPETSQPENNDDNNNAVVAAAIAHQIAESLQSDASTVSELDSRVRNSPLELYGPCLPPRQIAPNVADDSRKRARSNAENESKKRKITAAEYAERVSAKNSRHLHSNQRSVSFVHGAHSPVDVGQRSPIQTDPQGGGGGGGVAAEGIHSIMSPCVPVQNVHVNPLFLSRNLPFSIIPPASQTIMLPQNRRLEPNVANAIPNPGLSVSKPSNWTTGTERAAAIHPALPSSAATRDPRLGKPDPTGKAVPLSNIVPVYKFQERKGTADCLAKIQYKNVGMVYIGTEFPTLVLQWNPSWIRTYKRSGKFPDICQFYLSVKQGYEHQQSFYNTYVRLHLLDLWLRVCEGYDRNPFIEVNLTAEAIKPEGAKLECSAVVRNQDTLKREDIVLCRMNRPGGGTVEIFGRVLGVGNRACDPPKGQPNNGSSWCKIKIEIWCAEPLRAPYSTKLEIQVLFSIRLAMLQNEAAWYMSETIQLLVLKPRENESKINIVRCRGEEPKALRDKIARSLYLPRVQATLVDTTFLDDTVAPIRLLAYKLMMEGHRVLICMKREDSFRRMVKALVPHDPVIAIRNKDLSLTEDYARLTLEKRLEDKAARVADIYQRSPITLSLISALSLRECKREFTERPVICIFDDADLCTELESALPLKCRVERMVLFGKPDAEAIVQPLLRKYLYHISLFKRLYQAKLNPAGR